MNFNKILLAHLLLGFSVTAMAAPPASSPALLEKGKTVYTTNCLMCHGANGDGDTPVGKAMPAGKKPRNFISEAFKGADGKGKIDNPTVAQVREVVQKGVKGTTMTAYAHIPENDQWAVSYYILEMRKKK